MRTKSRIRTLRTGRDGFTLLEVLIAFTILAIAMGALLQSFSAGVQASRLSEPYVTAMLQARSKLDEIGVERPLTTGERTGRFENGFVWTVRVRSVMPDRQEDASGPALYAVAVTVSWAEGGAITLHSFQFGSVP